MKTHNGFITELEDNEVFVFGSNLSGIHGAGAAKTARKWGAKLGEGEGLFGKTYALPTVKEKIRGPLSISKIQKHVEIFGECVKANPDKVFLVTEVGCGLAGLKVEEIAPLFKNLRDLPNIVWPQSFVRCLVV
jgi:hypothetical protein